VHFHRCHNARIQTDQRTFALKVKGDSMIDKHIMDGDVAILETKEPKPGDVVAASVQRTRSTRI
jgi:repressor LexA